MKRASESSLIAIVGVDVDVEIVLETAEVEILLAGTHYALFDRL